MGENLQVILFGTGKALASFEKKIKNYGYEIVCYVDNDRNKWGSYVNGKKIISPQELKEYHHRIFISVAKSEEIYEQLLQMGLENKIVSMEDLIRDSIHNFSRYQYLKDLKINNNNEITYIFDSMFCLGWGGIEVWNYKISKALKDKKKECIIYRDTKQPYTSEDIEQTSIRFNEDKESYYNVVNDIIQDMLKRLPCVVINNWSEHVLHAAHAIRHYLGNDMVKVVSVCHFDLDFQYKLQSQRRECIDAYFCVSTKIKKRMEEEYSIPNRMLHYKESPVYFEIDYQKENENLNEPIRIGFACRLEVYQKRVDLIPQIVQELEKRNVNFILEIAGDGTYRDQIKQFTVEHGLENKVMILGLIETDKMPEYWKSQDIYLNVSDFEGTSQAMLEAMSYEVTPVVTDVSGVRDFIENGKNGCICEIGNAVQIAEAIEYLANNRKKLQEYGVLNRTIILERCKMEDYIAYLELLIEEIH